MTPNLVNGNPGSDPLVSDYRRCLPAASCRSLEPEMSHEVNSGRETPLGISSLFSLSVCVSLSPSHSFHPQSQHIFLLRRGSCFSTEKTEMLRREVLPTPDPIHLLPASARHKLCLLPFLVCKMISPVLPKPAPHPRSTIPGCASTHSRSLPIGFSWPNKPFSLAYK